MTNGSIPASIRNLSPLQNWMQVEPTSPFVGTECYLSEGYVHIDGVDYLHGSVFLESSIMLTKGVQLDKNVALEVLVDPYSRITVAFRIKSYGSDTIELEDADEWSWCECQEVRCA